MSGQKDTLLCLQILQGGCRDRKHLHINARLIHQRYARLTQVLQTLGYLFPFIKGVTVPSVPKTEFFQAAWIWGVRKCSSTAINFMTVRCEVTASIYFYQ